MRLYVGITDYDWFKLHAANPLVEEVNFWKPSSQRGFKVLQWGEPFLFKLKARRVIGGGGFFTKFLQLPLSLAWEGASALCRSSDQRSNN
ncbi:MAG: putative restriction endonuclease [Blastocatellia bacterium]|nr:putative restriction endonuclease [Blastocatellia bacterium]